MVDMKDLMVDVSGTISCLENARKHNALVAEMFGRRELQGSLLICGEKCFPVPTLASLLEINLHDRASMMRDMMETVGKGFRLGEWVEFESAPIVKAFSINPSEHIEMNRVALEFINVKMADHECENCGNHKDDANAVICVPCSESSDVKEALDAIEYDPEFFAKVRALLVEEGHLGGEE